MLVPWCGNILMVPDEQSSLTKVLPPNMKFVTQHFMQTTRTGISHPCLWNV